ncbi:MAG: hypothetical protein U0163_20155 [Gemmatimonadaceae bacterium]
MSNFRKKMRLPTLGAALLVVFTAACSDSTAPSARTGYITSSTAQAANAATVTSTVNTSTPSTSGTTQLPTKTNTLQPSTAGYNVPAF